MWEKPRGQCCSRSDKNLKSHESNGDLIWIYWNFKGELKIPVVKIAATEIVTGISGESEKMLRELFEFVRMDFCLKKILH